MPAHPPHTTPPRAHDRGQNGGGYIWTIVEARPSLFQRGRTPRPSSCWRRPRGPGGSLHPGMCGYCPIITMQHHHHHHHNHYHHCHRLHQPQSSSWSSAASAPVVVMVIGIGWDLMLGRNRQSSGGRLLPGDCKCYPACGIGNAVTATASPQPSRP